ncbi:FAD:protein FMN transferase [Pseudoxanthomonas wuyuanensis]
MNTNHTNQAIATLGGETMGTTWSVKLVVSPRADLHALHAGIQAQLDRVVAQMSTWEAESDISRFNASAAGSWQALPQEFFTVLSCALEIARDSDGAFDPTLGPLVDLWGFGPVQSPRRVPDAATLAATRQRCGWQRLVVQSPPHRVRQPGSLHLDLSAIAKGYGVDLVAGHLRDRGIASALVEVGGELYGYGRKPDGAPWRVLVESSPDEEAADEDFEPRVLALEGFAVATSGDRWHRFEQQGTRYAHTLDPRSGQPVEHAPAAVTVVADSAMRADAWATALTVLGPQQGLRLAETRQLAARFALRTNAGMEEMATPNFRTHLQAAA